MQYGAKCLDGVQQKEFILAFLSTYMGKLRFTPVKKGGRIVAYKIPKRHNPLFAGASHTPIPKKGRLSFNPVKKGGETVAAGLPAKYRKLFPHTSVAITFPAQLKNLQQRVMPHLEAKIRENVYEIRGLADMRLIGENHMRYVDELLKESQKRIKAARYNVSRLFGLARKASSDDMSFTDAIIKLNEAQDHTKKLERELNDAHAYYREERSA